MLLMKSPPLEAKEPAMEPKLDGPKSAYRALVISMSLVIAFLAANPFADAVGLPQVDDRTPMPAMFRIIGGVVLFFAASTFLGFLIGLARDAIGRLGSSSAKPDRWIALASIVCGTVCLLAAVQATFAANYYLGGPAPPTMTFQTGPGMPQGSLNMAATGRSSPALTLVSLLTFLAGAGLLAFGIWGSLKPAATLAPTAMVPKPEGWGEPMIDAARA
jgi:hypothetical protein